MKAVESVLAVFLLLFATGSSQAWAVVSRPVLVKHLPEKVFVPMGFDDNDDVQIVLEGTFPDTCYKVGPVTAVVDRENRKILLQAQAYHYPNCWCIQVRVPYLKTVSLGVLPTGEYDLLMQEKDGAYGKAALVPVGASTNEGPDDYLYAPVADAEVEVPEGGGDPVLVLRGTFQNSCMKLREVRTINNPTEVVSVLPISEMPAAPGPECREERRAFTERVALKGLQASKTLVHVRSLNGQSLNRLVER